MAATQTDTLPAPTEHRPRTPTGAKPKTPVAPDLIVSACTAQHRGDRAEQQDRVFLFSSGPAAEAAPAIPMLPEFASIGRKEPAPKRHALAVLADGLGGMTGGSLAAENVMLIAKSRFQEFIPGAIDETAFFRELVDECHAVISIAAITSALEPHTTFTALLVQQHRVDWCHVGDSRIYHFRQGHMMSVTEDHTLQWQLVREGKSPEKAALHPQAHKLVNTLGGVKAPAPALGHLDNPQSGDAFLLCSDGLWSYFDPMELGTIIVSFPAGQAASRLIALARERANGKGDNCSLALIKYDAVESQAEAVHPDLMVNSRWL